MTSDLRLYAPAVSRNREPILKVLQSHLPIQGLILEIASGSGEHVSYFAQNSSPDLVFQPSDPDDSARGSIDSWTKALDLPNIRPALMLDCLSPEWPIQSADAVICINMVHISPWEATHGLMRGAEQILPAQGLLYLYGPFRVGGGHTAPSNQSFDEGLRQRNPAWGVRDLEAVERVASDYGFGALIVEQMPANNLSLIFRRK